jgi:hypothetical protein
MRQKEMRNNNGMNMITTSVMHTNERGYRVDIGEIHGKQEYNTLNEGKGSANDSHGEPSRPSETKNNESKSSRNDKTYQHMRGDNDADNDDDSVGTLINHIHSKILLCSVKKVQLKLASKLQHLT